MLSSPTITLSVWVFTRMETTLTCMRSENPSSPRASARERRPNGAPTRTSRTSQIRTSTPSTCWSTAASATPTSPCPEASRIHAVTRKAIAVTPVAQAAPVKRSSPCSTFDRPEASSPGSMARPVSSNMVIASERSDRETSNSETNVGASSTVATATTRPSSR